MNSMDLLEAMGFIRDKYIEEAHQKKQPRARTIPLRKALLIAAIVSLMLLLAGCVAVLLGLDALDLGQQRYDAGFGQEQTQNLISLQGYQGTPNYRAALEWKEYLDSFDRDQAAREADAQGYTPPAEYEAYECFNQDMEEKIQSLCERYGLHPLGVRQLHTDARSMLQGLGQGALFPEDGPVTLYSGYCYPDGTFQLEGDLAMDGGTLSFQCRLVKKSAFDSVFLGIGDKAQFRQWEYVTAGGKPVQLALSQQKGLILADCEGEFITINLLLALSDRDTLSEKELEEIADLFPFGGAAAQPAPDAGAEEPYREVISTLPLGSTYCLRDLDGDGTPELLVGKAGASGSRVEEIYNLQSAGVTLLTKGEELYLCEGNILEQVVSVQGRQDRWYFRLREGELETAECLMHSQAQNAWYWSETGAASALGWEEISEEEYYAVMAKYPWTALNWQYTELREDASQVPADRQAIQGLYRDILAGEGRFHDRGAEQDVTIGEYCDAFAASSQVSLDVPRFAVADLDGDGTEEVVLWLRVNQVSDYGPLVLHHHDGKIYGDTFSHRQMGHIRADGSFWYSGGGDHDGAGRIEFMGEGYRIQPVSSEGIEEQPEVSWQDYPNSDYEKWLQ